MRLAPRGRGAKDRQVILAEALLSLVVWAGCCAVMLPVAAMPDTAGGTFAFDFRDTMWVPIKDILAGHMPWDVVGYAQRHPTSQICPLYLPGYMLLTLPALLLPYRMALALWLGVISVAVVALAHLALTIGRRSGGPRHLVAAVAGLTAFLLITPPVKSGVLAANWAVVCGVAAAWELGRDEEDWRAVALTCLAIVKPQVGLPLLALQLLTGRWRTALRAWALSLALAAPALAMAVRNAGGLRASVRMFLGTASRGEGYPVDSDGSTRLDLVGTLGHQGIHLGAAPVALVTFVVAALAIGTAVVLWRNGLGATCWFALLAGFGILLVTPNWLYAVTVVVPGLVAVGRWLCRHRRRGDDRAWLTAACLALACVPFVTFQRLARVLGVSLRTFNTINGVALNLALVAGTVAAWRTVRARGGRPATPCTDAAALD